MEIYLLFFQLFGNYMDNIYINCLHNLFYLFHIYKFKKPFILNLVFGIF
uniref:Uncharacterized protein n=1 Tax=Meloidogyne enterolobii TaxID=390850 RepID=A0A6V7W332_MELEN|nr:unnamed protein product [Meloidogyne enterolobii]